MVDTVTINRDARGPERLLPLSHQQFEILLALSDRDLHGYGILDASAAAGVRLGTGALYTAIARLVELKLIRETDQRDADDARRRYYALTASGRAALTAETGRLEALVAKARRKGIRPRALKAKS
jgi:DNA-binding PadR family transcriptional regulator